MRASVPEAVLRGTSHRKAPMSSTRVIDAQFAHAMHDSLTLHIAITHSKPPTTKVGPMSPASTSAPSGESAYVSRAGSYSTKPLAACALSHSCA